MRTRPFLSPLRERPLLWAVPLVVVIALAGTADMIFREDVRRLYEGNADIQDILMYARQATPATMLRWWSGVWLQASSSYYRPLSSMLIYAEARLFGGAWRPFCIVSWLMHAGVCVTMLLFLRGLSRGSPIVRVLPGVLATALFSIPCETTVNGPHWGNRGIARGIMPYWPAQTDIGCLLLSLLSLMVFDRWLESTLGATEVVGAEAPPARRGRWLAGAIGFFVAALLFKEQAVIVPLLAALLAIYRRAPARRIALGAALGLAASSLFLLLRRLLVPQAWSPEFEDIGQPFLKLAVYLCEPAVLAVVNHQAWILISAVLVSGCIGIGLWRRRLAVYAFLGLLVGLFGPPQVLAGNMALPTVWPQGWWLVRVTWFCGLLLLAWVLRGRGPSLALLGGLLVVHLPILHVMGPHYYYWPVAWWSMLVAVTLASAPGAAKDAD
jgi:hypothetical protein